MNIVKQKLGAFIKNQIHFRLVNNTNTIDNGTNTDTSISKSLYTVTPYTCIPEAGDVRTAIPDPAPFSLHVTCCSCI